MGKADAAKIAKPKKSHGVASLGSPRLSVILAALERAGSAGATGLDLTRLTNSLAIATSISEIRRQLKGRSISCTPEGTTATGARVYRYVLS
jgi:hypothetical protein